MTAFTPYEDRDAWFVIRGYVYQVHTTILEWLTLAPGYELWLECGEDIDRVQEDLSRSESGDARILEQIKHRQKAATLRSPDVIEAVVSFFRHARANPNLKLRFRFLTTSRIGREQKTGVPGGEAALEVWENLRSGMLSPQQEESVVVALRSLLLEGTTAHTDFQDFLKAADATQLTEFMRSVEWASSQPSMDELRKRIDSALVASGRAATEEDSRRLLERLFLHVFKVLSSKGKKVLTTASLEQQISRSTLDSSEEKLLAVLGQILHFVVSKIEGIEGIVREQGEWMGNLSEQVLAITSQPEWNLYQGPAHVQGIPNAVAPLIRRSSQSASLRDGFASNTWMALYGDLQSGKTQLALQVATDFAQTNVWIRLDDLDAREQCRRIDSSLALATRQAPVATHQEWYARICQKLGAGTLIVLDGLALTAADRALMDRVLLLKEACQRIGLKVLSTSSRRLPSSLVDQMGKGIGQRSIAEFNEEEKIEMFRLFGAPEKMLKKTFVDFAGGITRNHPALLISLAQFLKSRNWRMDDSAWDALFRSTYNQDLKIETEQILKHTVEDEASRSLLYRLTVAMAAFTEDDVVKVAEVEPTIPLPLERFHEAIGSWIQKDGDKEYRVAPLLGALGHKNLAPNTVEKTHRHFGQKFFRKKPVTLLDAVQTIGHFHSAKAFDTAAAVLVLSLNAFLRENGAREDFGLSSLWVGVGIPEAVDLKTRLLVRALQASALQKLGKNSDEMLAELDLLLDRASGSDQLGVFGASVTIAIHFSAEKPAMAIRYAVRAVKNANAMKQIVRKRKERVPEIAALVWACGAACRNADDVEAWFTEIGKLDLEQRAALFNRSPMSNTGCQTVCDRLWLKESDKPEGKRDWPRILKLLTRIEEFGREWNSEIVSACATRAKIVIHAEYQSELEMAAQLAQTALSEKSGDADVTFLLCECIGRQYRYTKNWASAKQWLDRALEIESDSFPILRQRALLELAVAEEQIDREAAVKSCDRAVALARRSKSLSDLRLIEALGEKAIACWNVRDRKGAFACWEEGATKVLDWLKRDDDWKSLVGMFAHASGYFSALFSGIEPKPASEYVVPEPGWFLRERKRISEVYVPKREWVLAAHISMMAEGIEQTEKASGWALRALDMGRKGDELGLSETFAMYAVPAAVAEDRFADAIELAASSMSSLMMTGARRRGPDAKPTTEEAVTYEKKTAAFSLVPAGFRLASLWLTNREECKRLASSLALRCRRMAENSPAGESWTQSGDAIQEVFSENANAEGLLARSRNLDQKDEPATRILFFLGAILHAGPARAYALQLGLYPYLEETFKKFGIYRQNLVPFLLDFWRQSVEAEPYLYKQPGLLKDRLEEIERTNIDGKEKAILEELSWSLATRPNAEMHEWLRKRSSTK
jgi:hypothetical protein